MADPRPDSQIDELFGGADSPKPRTLLVVALIVSGLAVAILGLACSSLPGGMLVLAGWYVAESDDERIESGYLPLDARPQVRALRATAAVGVMAVIAMLLVQGGLLCTGFYHRLWGGVLDVIIGVSA